jgi:hypothetical protein
MRTEDGGSSWSDSDRCRQQLVKSPRRRTPEQLGLVYVELQTIGAHPVSDVVDTRRQRRSRWTGAVDLSVVRIQMRTEAVPLNDADQISNVDDKKKGAEHRNAALESGSNRSR